MTTWDELEPDTRRVAPATPVRVGMRKVRGGRARMVVIVDREILERLGGRAMRYRLAAGRGAAGHQVHVAQDDQGRFEALACGPPEPAKYSVDGPGRALVVDLPAWAWTNSSRRAAA